MITKEWLEDYKLKADAVIALHTDIGMINLAKIILLLLKELEEKTYPYPTTKDVKGYVDEMHTAGQMKLNKAMTDEEVENDEWHQIHDEDIESRRIGELERGAHVS